MWLVNAFESFAVRKRADRESVRFGLAAFLEPLSTFKKESTTSLWNY